MTSSTPRLRLAICIATRGRPKSLGRVLDALFQIHLPPAAALRLVVIDNDPAASSRAVCESRSPRSPWPLEYAVEPRPGIPFARNTAIETCYRDTDAVVFIDDDEFPDADWLQKLVETRERYGADVVTGPALPQFEQQPPSWVIDGQFFDPPRYPTGTLRDTAFTNNVLINSSVFQHIEGWFDPRLQFTGGSDTHFFRRLHLSGCSIVWSDDAVVRDCIPPSRVMASWLIQRAYRYGHTHAFVRVDLKQNTRLQVAMAAMRRLLPAGVNAVLAVIGLSRMRMVNAARELAYMIGMLANLVGRRYAEYAIGDPASRSAAPSQPN